MDDPGYAPRGATPRLLVGHVALGDFDARSCDEVPAGRPDQGANRCPLPAQGSNHVTPDQSAPAGDENRHAGSNRGKESGRTVTWPSIMPMRTVAAEGTSRRSTASPIQTPDPGGPSGNQATLVSRPTSL